MIFQTYDLSKRLYDIFTENQVPAFADGTYNRQAFEAEFSAMSVSGKIDLVLRTLNNFEVMDTFLNAITITDSMPTQVEMWADGEFQKSNRLAHATKGEFHKRTLTIRTEDYAYEVDITKDEIMRAITQQKLPAGNRKYSNMTSIDMMLETIVTGYQRKLRQLALDALFANPTSEDPTLPVLYRDTTGFATANQVIPPRNGLLTFETAESQEHHLFNDGVTPGLLKELRKLVRNKGANGATLVTIANETTWEKFAGQFTNEELESLKFQRELGIDNLIVSPITSTINYVLADSDMPNDYWVCLDLSKKILKRTIPDTLATGVAELSVDFNTLSKLMAMRGEQEASPETIAMADNSLETSIINGAMKVTLNKTGFGVISCGMGAVAYTGTGATEYIEPSWEV